jgi:hypothetical protein
LTFHHPSFAALTFPAHWTLFLAAIFIIPLVAIVAWYRRKEERLYQSSAAWVPATGTLIEVEDVAYDDGDYSIRLKYRYQVGQTQFLSKRHSFGKQLLYKSDQELKVALEHWKVGQEVSVYYDPQNPPRAVIERKLDIDPSDPSWSIALISLLFLYAALLALGVIRFKTS